MKEKLNNENAITLIALIITIIVILILASITISSLSNGGTVQKAKEQRFKAALSSIKEDYEVSKIAFEDEQGLNINDFPVADYIRSYNKYERNLNDAISLIQNEEDALNEVQSMLQRMQELLVQSSNDTYTSEDRNSIHDELVQLTQEIDRISNTIEFNGIKVLNNDNVIKTFYETDNYFEIQLNDISANALGISIENDSMNSSEKSLETVKSAIDKISNIRSNLGMTQNSIEDKIYELSKRAIFLQKYKYLDEIKLRKISGNGNDESENIQKIDEVLGNIVGIGTLNVDILKNELSSLEKAIQNAENVVRISVTVEKATGKIHEALQRMIEIATMASNGTNSSNDRQIMQNEINALIQDINDIVNSTEDNGEKLLDGSYNKSYVIGTNGGTVQLSIDSCSINNIGENGTAIYADVTTVENAKKTLNSINFAIDYVSTARLKIGAKTNRTEHAINNLKNIQENINSAIDYLNSNEQYGTDNLGGSINTVQLAEGSLDEIQDMLQRINELVENGENGTYDDIGRKSIITEINELKAQIDMIANETTYGGKKLLNGTYSENHTIGIYGETVTIQINDCSASKILPINLNESNLESFSQAKSVINNAIDIITFERNKLGAIQNRLEYCADYHTLIKNVLNLKLENQTKKDLRLSLAGLEEIQSILSRLNELVIQARSPITSDIEKRNINYEIDQLLQEINRISNYTKSNEMILLNGQYDTNNNVTVSGLDLAGLNLEALSSQATATEQLKKVQKAIGRVFSLRKELAIKEGTYERITGKYIIEGELANKVKVSDGKLVYIGKDKNEKKWAQDLGIQVE